MSRIRIAPALSREAVIELFDSLVSGPGFPKRQKMQCAYLADAILEMCAVEADAAEMGEAFASFRFSCSPEHMARRDEIFSAAGLSVKDVKEATNDKA